MKRIVLISAVSLIVGLGAGWLLFNPSDSGNSESEREILYYRDPMNPQNTSPTPKKAPDGMDFVPVYAEQSKASGERRIAYYKDPMHPWFTSERPGKAPDCGMDLVPVYEGEGDSNGIKIDPVTVQNIGVKTEKIERRKLTKVIRTVGKVDLNEPRVYSVNTKIMGWVENLHVDYTGKIVHQGDPLLELYSPELVSTQEEYLQAIRYKKQLAQSSIEEARKGADELIQSALRRLQYWDISEREIKELEDRGTPKKTMTFYSPVDGIVLEKMVNKGQSVMAGMDLYKIADISTVWILADIYQYELPWVKVGQEAEVELSYLAGRIFRGTVSYIYPTVNMETKTAKVRVVVENTRNFDLKPEMFATVKISSPVVVDAVAVPDQAIIRSGERNVAVIALGGGYFEPREIKLGVMADGYVQVLNGVRAGETIVTSSQFLIDSESNLKAAVSQMSGHEGHDMSKPMEETTDQSMTSGGHEDHDMSSHKAVEESKKSAMESATSSGHEGHDMKDMETKKQDSVEAVPEEVVDPVCGMTITPDKKRSYKYKGATYYFCSSEDMEEFKGNPEAYIPKNQD